MNRTICLVALATLVSPYAAAAGDFSCPDEIKSEQTLAGQAPAAWTPWVDVGGTRHSLTRVDFYEGLPKLQAQLAPDNEDDLESKPRHWRFVAPKGQPQAVIWQVCRYTSTSVTLSRELPAALKSCTVTHKPSLGDSHLTTSCN